MLTDALVERYSRQILLAEVGNNSVRHLGEINLLLPHFSAREV